jgi:hypothetical protein
VDIGILRIDQANVTKKKSKLGAPSCGTSNTISLLNTDRNIYIRRIQKHTTNRLINCVISTYVYIKCCMIDLGVISIIKITRITYKNPLLSIQAKNGGPDSGTIN